ncbi:2-hydroxyacid dehydrogenase [Limisalsivibrio acetivorans]|uniref:2-hydroxyacid dehydrogenase n=1 Tax=Limisalsivibrio acetivorans TaxID=1304888 RepID=UPI0003B52A7C|nr:2-hydroxyacid dehydrogenase [Limisalsivibrio acetivorans]
MKTAVFSTKPYDMEYLGRAFQDAGIEHEFFEARLRKKTAKLARNFEAVCIFVNDTADAEVLEELSGFGIKLVTLRCAGFNNVDLKKAEELGIKVTRVPAYSPYSVAEHTIGLMLSLNRHFHRAFWRVREANFSLDGLMGFDMHGKTVGVIGTGSIGRVVCRILNGFGMKVLGYDIYEDEELKKLGITYTDTETIFKESDIITLHTPLTPETKYLINENTLAMMKEGIMLINTSRGGLVDTRAVISALKSGRIGSLGLDVYEEEGDLFFEDLSDYIVQDDVFMRLLTFPNVLITGHQAFFTTNAMEAIAETTAQNIKSLEVGRELENSVTTEKTA